MKKEIIATLLLCAAIALIAAGMCVDNLILCSAGGFIAGIYNSIINKKKNNL